jgi:hypothetical protein
MSHIDPLNENNNQEHADTHLGHEPNPAYINARSVA